MRRLCGSELASAGSWCTFPKDRSVAGQKSETHSGGDGWGRREQEWEQGTLRTLLQSAGKR